MNRALCHLLAAGNEPISEKTSERMVQISVKMDQQPPGCGTKRASMKKEQYGGAGAAWRLALPAMMNFVKTAPSIVNGFF